MDGPQTPFNPEAACNLNAGALFQPICYAMSVKDTDSQKNTTVTKSYSYCILCSTIQYKDIIVKIAGKATSNDNVFNPQRGLSFTHKTQTPVFMSDTCSKANVETKKIIIGNLCYFHLAAIHNIGAKYVDRINTVQIVTAPYYVDVNNQTLMRQGRLSNIKGDDNLFPKIIPILSLSMYTSKLEFEKYFNQRSNFSISPSEISLMSKIYEYMTQFYASLKQINTEDALYHALVSFATCQDPILNETFKNVNTNDITVACRFSKAYLDKLKTNGNHIIDRFDLKNVSEDHIVNVPMSRFAIYDQRTLLSFLPFQLSKNPNTNSNDPAVEAQPTIGQLPNITIYNNWICSGIGQGFPLGGLTTDQRTISKNLKTFLPIEKNSSTFVLQMKAFVDDMGIVPMSIYDRTAEYSVAIPNSNIGGLTNI